MVEAIGSEGKGLKIRYVDPTEAKYKFYCALCEVERGRGRSIFSKHFNKRQCHICNYIRSRAVGNKESLLLRLIGEAGNMGMCGRSFHLVLRFAGQAMFLCNSTWFIVIFFLAGLWLFICVGIWRKHLLDKVKGDISQAEFKKIMEVCIITRLKNTTAFLPRMRFFDGSCTLFLCAVSDFGKDQQDKDCTICSRATKEVIYDLQRRATPEYYWWHVV